MGAGNYFFSAPAGDNWSLMVYVDLQPHYWGDEEERRNAEFADYLKSDPAAEAALLQTSASDETERERTTASLRRAWLDENYPYVQDEQTFYEDQAECQEEDIFSALSSAFPKQVVRPDRDSATIGDATVLGEVGRMTIARAYTYYGDRMALIVTPGEHLQEEVWKVEHGALEFERRWPCWQLAAMRAENARLAGIKRAVKTGALAREMEAVFMRMLMALHGYGMADDMSFRSGPWTSGSYRNSQWFQRVAIRKTARRTMSSAAGVAH